MKMKFLRRSPIIRNHIVFILVSVPYLQVVLSLSRGVSALDDEVLTLMQDYWLAYILCIITTYATYKVSKLAKYLSIIYALYITVCSTMVFIQDFNKIILVLAFSYILISYYFYLLLKSELEQALYKAGFNRHLINNGCEYDLPVSLKTKDKQTSGRLSNWDEKSCFVAIDENAPSLKNDVQLTVMFEGKEFVTHGTINTHIHRGVGIQLKQNAQVEYLGWNEFYDIIKDRGYRLRC